MAAKWKFSFFDRGKAFDHVLVALRVWLYLGAFIQGFQEISCVDIEYTINVPDEDVTTIRTKSFRPYFKILTKTDSGKIYIGGREELLILNSMTLEISKTVTIPKNEMASGDSGLSLTCAELAGTMQRQEKICQNYIRLAEDINSTTILVCGTNSYDPMCRFVTLEGEEYELQDGRIDAKKKVQYSIEQNTTALFNQINERLFVGHNEESQPNPSHISKFTINSGTMELDLVAQTDDQNENYINEPDFVGKPFSHNNFTYFFYRETAVEAVNQGKFVYSRVGRVCENDVSSNLDTFFKARLNCSLQGEFPFYFDHIQDVIVGEDVNGDPIFYAVFTTTPHGPASSAVCSYRMDDIINVFETSKFKGKSGPGKLPGPIDRPSYAHQFTECQTAFTNTQRNFQRDNPLMDELVPNFNANNMRSTSHPPLFYSTQMNLYSIAYDKEQNIFYVGTEHGTILKAVRGVGAEWLVYQQELSDVKHPITGLYYSDATQSLLVVNERGLYRVDVSSCQAFCEDECEKSYSGYCSVSGTNCVSKRPPIVSQEMRAEVVRILSLSETTIKSCRSRRVELTCELKGSEACGEVNLTWSFSKSADGTGSETLVSCSGGTSCEGRNSTLAPFVQFQEISHHLHYKLVHLTVNVYEEHTAGYFTCAGESRSTTVKIEVDESPGCLTLYSYEQRQVRRDQLGEEHDALSGCNDSTSSDKILFQTCDQCPGDVRINK